MPLAHRALIVGAGVGGLAACVALRRAGWEVRIHERAANPRELGFGLLLAPNALAALDELGLGDRLRRTGTAATRVEIRRLDGRLLRRLDTQVGGPTMVALRPELHGALLDAVGSDALRLGSEVRSYHRDGDGAGIAIALRDGTTESGDVLIGADGVDSIVRRRLHPSEPPPRPSGFCAIRGVSHGVASVLGDLAAVGYLDEGVEAATALAGRDVVYWYFSLLSSETPTPAADPRAALADRLERADMALRTVVAAARAEDVRFDDLWRRDPLRTWGDGPVTLLGDAAHPLLPHTGQGAAQALEDAVALGLAISGSRDAETALRRYEAVRASRTASLVRLGPRIARVTTTRSVAIQTARTAAIRLLPAWALQLSARATSRDPHLRLR
jgi:2-polyprenyl-6-methoxyphenol hydroxylase-like FAD-dependent oxidoreductase